MSDKPRDFWIATESSITKNASGGTMYFSHTFIKNPEPTDIHVIEKSAFDALKEECERLKAQFSVAELEAKTYSDLLKEVCEEQASHDLVRCCECEKQVSQNMTDKDFCTAAAIVNGEILERDDPTYFCFDCKMKEKDAEIARLREALSGLYSHLGHDWCPVCDENAIHCEMGKARDALSISTSNQSGGKNDETV